MASEKLWELCQRSPNCSYTNCLGGCFEDRYNILAKFYGKLQMVGVLTCSFIKHHKAVQIKEAPFPSLPFCCPTARDPTAWAFAHLPWNKNVLLLTIRHNQKCDCLPLLHCHLACSEVGTEG